MSVLTGRQKYGKNTMEMKRQLSEDIKKLLIQYQRIEITEHLVYKHLASKTKGKNREVLQRISNDEGRHAKFWSQYTGMDINPKHLTIWKYLLIQMIFGLTFTIKMMEKGEETAERNYGNILKEIPEAKPIMREEQEHEKLLVEMIDERKIEYIGSMVLGLNDALVELTGALAGLSLALQNTRLIGMAGLITGIAASLSMASSEYLSKRTEASDQNPFVASFYTGIAYIITVILLVGPFFIFHHYLIALANTLIFVVLVIWFFSFFVSIVKEMNFRRTFVEMIVISLGVAIISFGIGFLTRHFLGVEA